MAEELYWRAILQYANVDFSKTMGDLRPHTRTTFLQDILFLSLYRKILPTNAHSEFFLHFWMSVASGDSEVYVRILDFCNTEISIFILCRIAELKYF